MNNPNRPDNTENRFRARMHRSTRRVFYWTSAWLLATALLAFGPKWLWPEVPILTFVALAINILVGIGMVVASKNHLKDMDEMHQRVQLEAMAITLGVALLVGIPWSLLNSLGVVPIPAEFSHVVLLMGLTFLTTTCLGLRRYR
jgi:predicted DNA repair protein MutK